MQSHEVERKVHRRLFDRSLVVAVAVHTSTEDLGYTVGLLHTKLVTRNGPLRVEATAEMCHHDHPYQCHF
jgi:hypothetical protein